MRDTSKNLNKFANYVVARIALTMSQMKANARYFYKKLKSTKTNLKFTQNN